MQNLSAAHGIQAVFDAFGFIRISFGSYDETEQFIPEIDQKFGLLKKAEGEYQNAKMIREVQSAKIKRIDDLLSTDVLQISRKAKVIVKGKTNDPVYMSLFPVAPSVGMKSVGSEDQSRYVRNILHQIETEEVLAELRSDLPALKQRQEDLVAVLAQREQQKDKEQQTKLARDRVMKECCSFYNQLYIKILQIFPEEKSLVESFFYSPSRRKKAAAETEIEENE